MYAIDPSTGYCKRIAGTGSKGEVKDGPALSATFNKPTGVAVVDGERSAYVCDSDNHALRRITLPSVYFSDGMHFASPCSRLLSDCRLLRSPSADCAVPQIFRSAGL